LCLFLRFHKNENTDRVVNRFKPNIWSAWINQTVSRSTVFNHSYSFIVTDQREWLQLFSIKIVNYIHIKLVITIYEFFHNTLIRIRWIQFMICLILFVVWWRSSFIKSVRFFFKYLNLVWSRVGRLSNIFKSVVKGLFGPQASLCVSRSVKTQIVSCTPPQHSDPSIPPRPQSHSLTKRTLNEERNYENIFTFISTWNWNWREILFWQMSNNKFE